MIYYDQDDIEVFEKKYTIENVLWMYREGSIKFVRTNHSANIEKIFSKTIDAIDLGIPMPTVYVSEQQNGDWIVLDGTDKLYYLIAYLNEESWICSKICKMYMYNDKNQNRKLHGKIMDAVIPFQVIEYRSKKYIHMFIGSFLENWSMSREHEVRKLMYRGEWEDGLSKIRNCTSWCAYWFKEYDILYMLVVWKVYRRDIREPHEKKAEEQYLIECVIQSLESKTDESIELFVQALRELTENRGIFSVIDKTYDYKFWIIIMGLMVCWFMMGKEINVLFKFESSLRVDIKNNESLTYRNICRWLEYEENEGRKRDDKKHKN